MKRLFLLLALVVAVSCESEAPERMFWDVRMFWDKDKLLKLNGDIESVTITQYGIAEKFGEIVPDEIGSRRVYNFSELGDVSEITDYDSDGSIREKHKFEYSPDGDLIAQACYNADGSLKEKKTWVYNSAKQLVGREAYIGSSSYTSWKEERKYDSSGNQIEEVYYGYNHKDGSLESKRVSEKKYDPDENLTEWATAYYSYNSSGVAEFKGKRVHKYVYASDGSKVEEYNYAEARHYTYCDEFGFEYNTKRATAKYDSKGNKIEHINYNDDGTLRNKATAKYDLKGNKIEHINYNDDGTLRNKATTKYDSNGNKIEEINYNGDGTLRNKATAKYDSNGNKIEEIDCDSNDKSERMRVYKYDRRGNNIEVVRYVSDGIGNFSLRYKIENKYDRHGNITELLGYDSNNNLDERIECLYDSNNNLTYLKYRSDGHRNFDVELQITYR